jgi:hypothetical protein
MKRVIGGILVLFVLGLPRAIVHAVDSFGTRNSNAQNIAIAEVGWSLILPAVGIRLLRKPNQSPRDEA